MVLVLEFCILNFCRLVWMECWVSMFSRVFGTVMFSAKFPSISVFKNTKNPLIAGNTANIFAAQKFLEILFCSSLLLLSVLITITEAKKKSSCCFVFLHSLILKILPCCLYKQLCQLSSLLHWILFWEVQYSSLHMPGLSNSGKETTSRWNNKVLKNFVFNRQDMSEMLVWGFCLFGFFNLRISAIFSLREN